MIYLSKMAELAPEVRETMACGYWRGGDRAVEDIVLAGSDTVNVLGSEATVGDVERRSKRIGPRRAVVLGHGHKVGAAYVSRAFAASPALSGRALEGLVRDISAFDGCACYSPKNIYVQGDHRAFAERLLGGLARFAGDVSPVNPALAGVGRAGASNVHYPGSAPLLNVYEEPHDGDFDFIKVRYPYRARFAATNFKRNADWLREHLR